MLDTGSVVIENNFVDVLKILLGPKVDGETRVDTVDTCEPVRG